MLAGKPSQAVAWGKEGWCCKMQKLTAKSMTNFFFCAAHLASRPSLPPPPSHLISTMALRTCVFKAARKGPGAGGRRRREGGAYGPAFALSPMKLRGRGIARSVDFKVAAKQPPTYEQLLSFPPSKEVLT